MRRKSYVIESKRGSTLAHRAFAVLLLFFTFIAAAFSAPHLDSKQFLQKYMHFSNAEIAALERGEAVIKILNTSSKTEVAGFGAIRTNVAPDFFLEQYRDIVRFKKGKQVLAIGKFNNPPRLEDLKQLTFDSDDLQSIKDCGVGDCDIKLSAQNIQKFKKLDSSGSNWNTLADALVRQMLTDSVTRYLAEGDSSLGEYNDKKKPIRLADEFRSILKETPNLFQYVPEFPRYLQDFPKTKLRDVENFVYWSKEKFGMKPVVSITHATIYRPAEESGTTALISSRQIYATHYFDASLGLTALVGKRSNSSFYLMYLNRSRADALKGAFGGLKRMIVESRTREAMRENLKLIKARVEAAQRVRLNAH